MLEIHSGRAIADRQPVTADGGGKSIPAVRTYDEYRDAPDSYAQIDVTYSGSPPIT